MVLWMLRLRAIRARRHRLGRRPFECLEGRALLSLGAEGLAGPAVVVAHVGPVAPAEPADLGATVELTAVNGEFLANPITPVIEVEAGTAKADVTLEIKLDWTKAGKDKTATVKVEVKKGDDNKAIRDKIQEALNKDKTIAGDWEFKPRTNKAVKIEETAGKPKADDVKWKDTTIKGKVDGVPINSGYDFEIKLDKQ